MPSKFFSNARKKGKLVFLLCKIQEIAQQIVISIDAFFVLLALDRVQQSRLSYWDALIVKVALRARATFFYDADMYHGAHHGSNELRNPFLV